MQQLTALSNLSKETNKQDKSHNTTTGEQLEEANFENNESTLRTPLTGNLPIRTSPAPGAHSCTTDTASESDSTFHSPGRIHQMQLNHNPSSADLANSAFVKDFSRLVVVKMSEQASDLATVDGEY